MLLIWTTSTKMLFMTVLKKQTLKVKSHSALSITIVAYSRYDTILKVYRHHCLVPSKKYGQAFVLERNS